MTSPIFVRSLSTPYGLVALVDAEVPEAFPEWTENELSIEVGDHGVSVGTNSDVRVTVVLTDDLTDAEGERLLESDMTIGTRGFEVSNAREDYPVAFSQGLVHVSIYAQRARNARDRVTFVLTRPSSE